MYVGSALQCSMQLTRGHEHCEGIAFVCIDSKLYCRVCYEWFGLIKVGMQGSTVRPCPADMHKFFMIDNAEKYPIFQDMGNLMIVLEGT